jgi:hypothetical protein
VRHAVGRKCSGRVQGLARGLGGTGRPDRPICPRLAPTIQSSESAINQRSLHVLAYNLTRVMNIMGAQPRGSVRKGAVGSKQKPRKSTRCYVRAKRRVELRPSLDVPIIEFHNNRAKKKWCLHGTNNENSVTTFLFRELRGQSIDRASNGSAWKQSAWS